MPKTGPAAGATSTSTSRSLFRAADGGLNRACRNYAGHNSESFYRVLWSGEHGPWTFVHAKTGCWTVAVIVLTKKITVFFFVHMLFSVLCVFGSLELADVGQNSQPGVMYMEGPGE